MLFVSLKKIFIESQILLLSKLTFTLMQFFKVKDPLVFLERNIFTRFAIKTAIENI
jgi:hypothetical protein